MRKLFIFLFVLCCFINCETFDWGEFGEEVGKTADRTADALERQTTKNKAQQAEILQLEGSIIVAEDGTYLGKITNEYDSESAFNEFGTYGSEFSSESIWNKYGDYGSKYSTYSAFNPYTSTPPKIYKNGTHIGYLTVNKYVENAFNPHLLLTYYRNE